MAKRFSRMRDDGIVETSDSLSELAASAVRESDAAARSTFALIGLFLGGIVTYVLVNHYAPDWPKVMRFSMLLVGACSSAFIFSRLALALRMVVGIAVGVSILGGIGYLVWKAL